MTPLDLRDPPATPRPGDPSDLAGTVRNWAASGGPPPEVDVEPAAILAGLRAADPGRADQLADALTRFPAVGTEFAGFRLTALLGRGAFGRVYLAEQADLAGRPVALKVSVDLTGESRTLARLQHTHIVPVYSLHRTHLLQAVCMPFFGATTVAGLLRRYRRANALPATGRDLVSTLRVMGDETDVPGAGPADPPSGVAPPPPAGTHEVAALPAADGPRAGGLRVLDGLSYVNAVCWMGARLADALAHAHDRGIVHNDLKPANVLVTDDGSPMLLDFGVSDDLKLRSAAGTAPVGGTLPYMSPEQLAAVRDPAVRPDPRSDLYSLGIILFELLTGRYPFAVPTGPLDAELPRMAAERRAAPPRLRPLNPAVSPGLEAIVRKCLAADLAQRYQSAADLKDDLERHRADLPLTHAHNPSVRERARKWCRRHPKLASTGTIVALTSVLVGVLAAGIGFRNRQLARYEAEAALRGFDSDAAAARYLLGGRAPDRELADAGVGRCRAALARYGLPGDPHWESREAYAALPTEERHRVRARLSELSLLLARGLALQGDGGVAEAVRLNELAERLSDGDVPRAVWAQRAELAGVLGDEAEADRSAALAKTAPVATARDHYLLGNEALAKGRYREAAALFRRAADLDPGSFWAHLAQGLCHEGLGQFADARGCYTTAVALWPDFPWGHYNRGLVHLRLGDHARAKADLDRAAELTPDTPEVYLNRALAHQHLREYDAGLRDLDRAAGLGASPARVWFMRARVKDLAGDKAGAERDRAEGMRAEPTDDKGWVARGLARLGADLPGAVADFDAALRVNPRSFAALQNKAHALGRLGKTADAAAVLDRQLELYPDSVPAVAGRGVLRGRLGDWAGARADAERAVRLDGGAANLYQVAGIYALLSKHDPKHQAEAVRLLAAALRAGFGFEHVETDKDLDPVRDTPGFQKVLAGARAIAPAGKR